LRIHAFKPLADFGLARAKTGVEQFGRLGVREVQPTPASQQEFAANRRHGVKQMDRHTRTGQHIGGHQARRPTAHNGHIGLQNGKSVR